MKTASRRSRGCGWSARCATVALAIAFCTSAFADPSKNIVVSQARQEPVVKTTNKICYVVEGDSRIPQPCNRISAIPTTATSMNIYGHTPRRN